MGAGVRVTLIGGFSEGAGYGEQGQARRGRLRADASGREQGFPRGFPGGASGKESPARAGDIRDMGLIPGLEDSPGEGNGYPFEYSCLQNPMDKGA